MVLSKLFMLGILSFVNFSLHKVFKTLMLIHLFLSLILVTTISISLFADDIIITSDNNALLNRVVTFLTQQFSIKDLKPLFYFLGVEVISHKHDILLSQRRYNLDLLVCTKMSDAKPVLTPFSHDSNINATFRLCSQRSH